MSGRQLELQSLRRELNSARDLLGQLEARLQALEEESGFELVYPLPGASAEAPESPSPGSGGGYVSRGQDQVEEISPWLPTSPTRSFRIAALVPNPGRLTLLSVRTWPRRWVCSSGGLWTGGICGRQGGALST